jgi:uncharacterized membrane protein YccC
VRAVASKMFAGLGTFHPDKLALARGLRGATAVVLPLAIGGATGHIQYGAYMALGALPAGFASFEGETRSRVAAVVVASVGMALSTFVGAATAAASPWLLIPIVAVWAYFTGLAVCLGRTASIAIFQWPIALLISMALPADPADAALRAGLVLVGGLLHAVFVVASWMLRPGLREKTTLAASYQALADYASRLASGAMEPPAPAAFPAHAVLDDPNPFLGPALRRIFIDLLEEAERLRAALAALASQQCERGLAVDAAPILHRITEVLLARRAEQAALVSTLGEEIGRLTIPSNADCRWPGEALSRRLRVVGRILAELIEPGAQHEAGVASMTRAPAAIVSALATLRANLTIRTEAGRHALRLALVAALAEVLVQAMGLYQGRWATLTVFIVLKPDYTSTVTRGPQRALGTALGAMLGAAAAYLVDAHLGGLIAAAGIFIAAAYVVFSPRTLSSMSSSPRSSLRCSRSWACPPSRPRKRASWRRSSAPRSRSPHISHGRRGRRPRCRRSSHGRSKRIAITRKRCSSSSRIPPPRTPACCVVCKWRQGRHAATPKRRPRGSRTSLTAVR